MAKLLTDKITGGIYEYYHIDDNKIYYRGSSEKTLEDLDDFHRKGHTYNIFKKNGWKYSYTVFRSNLRRPIGEKLKARWVVKPKEMSREQLLQLESDSIKEKIKLGECTLNHDPEPLKSFLKYNPQ
tara:strand:+ start:493 stop:870 length:378 start_codon:yes stop_codon:yes gene_type:complete